ncbi:MAG: hypothetical protein [Bacteriophage sp.]|nr:MAG: hypothetical protein [Bacteriophage sp.]
MTNLISAADARKISESNVTKEVEEATQALSAAVNAACQMGERKVHLFREGKLLRVALSIAASAGYRAEIVAARDQKYREYLKVEW